MTRRSRFENASRLGLPGRFPLILLALATACGTETSLPTSPGPGPSDGEGADEVSAGGGPVGGVGFPHVSGPGRIYAFSELAPPGLDGYDDRDGRTLAATAASRYVLYDDGTFALQYSDSGVELLGAYTEYGGWLALHWYANATVPPEHPYPDKWPGPWEATATLDRETLVVTYPLRMWLDDFINAAYVREGALLDP